MDSRLRGSREERRGVDGSGVAGCEGARPFDKLRVRGRLDSRLRRLLDNPPIIPSAAHMTLTSIFSQNGRGGKRGSGGADLILNV